ncbi:basic proline-rich protein-like [Ovis aries]|uniref:basic proline-rich protein-like n=1 Tax=Ovis aries TaxID=9940 RepID=UPI001C2DF1E4|nr:basic proline-rich protein-like [Ovis aries]
MAACGSSVKIQRKQEPVTGLREAGQEGGAAAERLEPERPSWRRGQWPLWGASTPPPHAHAAVPGLRDPSPEPPPPPPALPPPLTGCSGIFCSDAAFKMAAPPPGNPLNRPLENRPGRPAAFTSRLQPSPPCQASPPQDAPGRPRHRPGAPRPSPGPPGNPPPTPARSRSAPPPPLEAAGLLPGPNCGLLGACSAPRATPPGLARKGATRAADQAGTRPLRAG